MTIVDDFTSYLWLIELKRKSDAVGELMSLIRRIERSGNGSEYRLTILKADQGGEFTSDQLADFCRERGIQQRFSPARHPELNGAVERQNRTVQESIISMLLDADLSVWFWPYAMSWYAFTHNRTGTRTNQNFKTPFESFYKRKPDLTGLIVFGSQGFGLDRREKGKLKARGRPCMFLGFSSEHRSYVVWWKDNNKIGYCRTARFNESK